MGRARTQNTEWLTVRQPEPVPDCQWALPSSSCHVGLQVELAAASRGQRCQWAWEWACLARPQTLTACRAIDTTWPEAIRIAISSSTLYFWKSLCSDVAAAWQPCRRGHGPTWTGTDCRTNPPAAATSLPLAARLRPADWVAEAPGPAEKSRRLGLGGLGRYLNQTEPWGP